MNDPLPARKAFLQEFQELSDELLPHQTPAAKLERLIFLLRSREHERPVDPLLYSAIVRRVYDQCPRAPDKVRGILLLEAVEDPIPQGPYAPRVLGLYRRVRSAS